MKKEFRRDDERQKEKNCRGQKEFEVSGRKQNERAELAWKEWSERVRQP